MRLGVKYASHSVLQNPVGKNGYWWLGGAIGVIGAFGIVIGFPQAHADDSSYTMDDWRQMIEQST